MILRPALAGSIGVLLAALPAPGDDLQGFEDRRIVRAVRLLPDEVIDLDGRLDDAVWDRAEPATDFLQQEPDNGAPSTERTEVRLAFDSRRLYIGVRCLDSEPDQLLGNQMQRDAPFSADDRFMWSLDTYLDERSGYFFEINPSGAMGDGLINTAGFGGFANKAWDGIWTARVWRTGVGWTAEIEIPFATLNFDPEAPAWGANFQRTIRRKNEESRWNGYSRNQGLTQMSTAGLIVGLEDISQGVGLDVKPYLVGRFSESPIEDRPRAYTGDVGADFFYNVTPQLRANFTLNTDFAETEVDQRQINLTRFPLFFPEKRDFFLEGSSSFEFSPRNGVNPFFSRRIGLDADGRPQRIDYGLKLTGQVGAQDVGVLQVRTAPSGRLPGEDYSVLRVKRRFLSSSHVGMIYTRRAERGTGAPELHTVGAEFSLQTNRFRGNQNLTSSGFFVWHNTPGGEGRSVARGLRISYPNDTWDTRLSVRELQENFDPAVGFTPRRGFRRANPALSYSPRPRNHPWIRRFSFGSNTTLFTDTKNRLLSRNYGLTPFSVELHSQDRFEFNVDPTYERLTRDFEIVDGVALPAGGVYRFTRYGIEVSTANRRTLSGFARLEWGDFFSGRRREFAVSLNLRPRPGLLAHLRGEWNKVELDQGRFSTSLVRGEVNAQFSPWISLANQIQYDTVTRVIGFQSRFRWILRPGNDIFLVLNHSWREDVFNPQGFLTLDRQLASKIVYTYRF